MHALETTRSTSVAQGHFGGLEGHKYCQLVTFRRNRTPVRTPVWFALDGDRVLVKTEDPSGKIKRIRNDGRVTLAPCTVLGRDLGPAITGVARILHPTETPHAEAMLRRRYSVGRWLFTVLVEPVLEWRGGAPMYVEITS